MKTHGRKQRQEGTGDQHALFARVRPQVRKDPAQAGQTFVKRVWTFHARPQLLARLAAVSESKELRSARLRMRRATAAQVCFRSAVARAAAPMPFRKVASRRNRSSAAAKAGASPGGQRSPVSS